MHLLIRQFFKSMPLIMFLPPFFSDINECKDISEQNSLCRNGRCVNTEGSYKCVCLPGFLASPQPDQCIPEAPSMEAEQ